MTRQISVHRGNFLRDFRRFVFRPRSAPTLPRPRQSLISPRYAGTNFSVISIRLGGNVQLLTIAREKIPVVLHRPVLAKIGFAAVTTFISASTMSAFGTTAQCMGRQTRMCPECRRLNVVRYRVLHSTDLLTDRSLAGKSSKISARCARRQILNRIFENPCKGQSAREGTKVN